MIEAKGHYEDVRQKDFISDSIDEDWVEQATRQIDASGGRDIEWYFHEQGVADAAQDLFEKNPDLNRNKIFVRPYPSGVPKKNPRINSIEEYENYEDQK